MRVSGDTLIFNTGKEIYTNCGVIGISEVVGLDGKKEWNVTEGRDGGICIDPDWDDSALTHGERVELANYMLGLWSRFKVCAEMGLRREVAK